MERGEIRKCYSRAANIYIPKEADFVTLGQFHSISLLNVERHVFATVFSMLLLLTNDFVDTGTQKAGVWSFQHVSMI